MMHSETILRVKALFLSVGFAGARVASADSAESLDFSAVAGCDVWSVHAEFDVPAGAFTGCLAFVNQAGFADRIGRIRGMVRAWLCRLEQQGGLYAITDSDGGVDFPYLAVQR